MFIMLSTYLVNPLSVEAEPLNPKPFDKSIADNLPIMFRIDSFIWMGLFIIAILFTF